MATLANNPARPVSDTSLSMGHLALHYAKPEDGRWRPNCCR